MTSTSALARMIKAYLCFCRAGQAARLFMRWIGFVAMVIVLHGTPAGAVDEHKICSGLSDGITGTREGDGVARGSPGRAQTLLTGNECEALKRREARVPLLELPQEDEDPMSLSVGTKGDGGMLRFKIPFSF